jgi:hypothetical protein
MPCFIPFSYGFNAKIRPVIVEAYIVSFANIGEDTVGPTSVTHKSEGLRGILEQILLFASNFLETSSSVYLICPRFVSQSIMRILNFLRKTYTITLDANSIYYGLFRKIVVQENSDNLVQEKELIFITRPASDY